jgi:hypothetical protein
VPFITKLDFVTASQIKNGKIVRKKSTFLCPFVIGKVCFAKGVPQTLKKMGLNKYFTQLTQ